MTAFRLIQPCNRVTAKNAPAGDAWIHEPKLDGYRLQVVKIRASLCLPSLPLARRG